MVNFSKKGILLILFSLALFFIWSDSVLAGWGNCCYSHTGTGCQSSPCEDCVCGIDSYCCNNKWDSICAGEAEDECASSCPCPGTGDCCSSNGTPGCTDQTCVDCVCDIDSYCCNNKWDSICADEAADECVSSCPCEPAGPTCAEECSSYDGYLCTSYSCSGYGFPWCSSDYCKYNCYNKGSTSDCSNNCLCYDYESCDCSDATCDNSGCHPLNCTAAGCGNYADGGGCWCDSACVSACDCCSDACSVCGYCPWSNGHTCTKDCQCASGYCVDGYCCNSACSGVCRHCDYASDPGTCYCYLAGEDPEDDCPGTGTCGGTCDGSCGCQYPAYGTDCGTCKICGGSGYCDSTPADDSDCGTIDCDGLNHYYQSGTESPTATEYCYYRDYSDITTNRCEGFGNCKDPNTADCTDYSDSLKYSCGTCKYISSSNCTGGTQGSCSNYAKGTSCGTDKECDGSGNCVSCADPTVDIEASKTNVGTGEEFKITVTGYDDNDVWYCYCQEDALGYDNQKCIGTQTTCAKDWYFTKYTPGTYTYYGKVVDSDDVHGCSSYHWSDVESVTVSVCKSNGDACSAASECCSGYCVDGYCCNSSCTGVCRSCAMSGYEGSCRCYYSGDDPEEECYGTGTCGGTCNGSCACQYPVAGTDCSTCKTCDGAGSCNQTPADDPDCGTIDCDGLNTYYQSGTESPTATEYCYWRDYSDITTNRCEGFGNCKDPNTADCTDYSDSLKYSCGLCKYISAANCTGGTLGSCSTYADGTSCGTNKSCDGGVCKTDTKIDCYFSKIDTTAGCIFDKETTTVNDSVWVCGILRTEGGTAISGETISLYVRTDGSYDKVFDVGTTDANGYACKSWKAKDDLNKYDDPKYIGTHKYVLFFAGDDNYNQSQTNEYSLTITCDPTCETPGAVGGYIAPLHCTTCQETCGWICWRAPEIPMGAATACTIKQDCKFPIYPYTILDNRGESCSKTNARCQTGACPNYAGWNTEICTTRKTNCSHILYGDFGVVNYGQWDASDRKCVQCDFTAHKEIANCGDTGGIYLECNYGERENAPCTGTADNKCESACGASPECDEKSPGDDCGTGKECDNSCQCVAYKPDLIITDIWDSNGTIKYTIKNQGKGDAGESYTALYVDGTYTEYDYVASLSAGSSSYGESFSYDWGANCTGESDLIQVCADYYSPRVDESDETNNCRSETWLCDITPPTTTISPNGKDWVNYDVGFTLTCTDDKSGCQTTGYKVIDESQTCDTSGLTTGTSGTVTCPTDQACRKKVCFRSIDNAGNVEGIKTSNLFKIDKAAPTTEVGP